MVKDPVCGMQVEESTAEDTATYQGKTYYFCSEDCKEQFEDNPQQYTEQTRRAGGS